MVKVVKYSSEFLSGILSAASSELLRGEVETLKNKLNGLKNNEWALVCLSENAEVVGYALGEIQSAGKEIIKDIFVIPALRRQGVGSVILVSAFYYATLRLSLRINAECKKNIPAAHFFAARTFSSAAETQNTISFTKSLLPMYNKEKHD